jgi:hypothetical protein
MWFSRIFLKITKTFADKNILLKTKFVLYKKVTVNSKGKKCLEI